MTAKQKTLCKWLAKYATDIRPLTFTFHSDLGKRFGRRYGCSYTDANGNPRLYVIGEPLQQKLNAMCDTVYIIDGKTWLLAGVMMPDIFKILPEIKKKFHPVDGYFILFPTEHIPPADWGCTRLTVYCTTKEN